MSLQASVEIKIRQKKSLEVKTDMDCMTLQHGQYNTIVPKLIKLKFHNGRKFLCTWSATINKNGIKESCVWECNVVSVYYYCY